MEQSLLQKFNVETIKEYFLKSEIPVNFRKNPVKFFAIYKTIIFFDPSILNVLCLFDLDI